MSNKSSLQVGREPIDHLLLFHISVHVIHMKARPLHRNVDECQPYFTPQTSPRMTKCSQNPTPPKCPPCGPGWFRCANLADNYCRWEIPACSGRPPISLGFVQITTHEFLQSLMQPFWLVTSSYHWIIYHSMDKVSVQKCKDFWCNCLETTTSWDHQDVVSSSASCAQPCKGLAVINNSHVVVFSKRIQLERYWEKVREGGRKAEIPM